MPGRSGNGAGVSHGRRDTHGVVMNSGSGKDYRLREIVERFGGELVGDADVRVSQVATLENAGPRHISFLAQQAYRGRLEKTRAAAVIIGVDARDLTPLPRIVCDNPYAYFAQVSWLFNPPRRTAPGVHASAVISEGARIAASASIDAHAVIGRRARVGEHAVIGAGCVIGEETVIGEYSRLYPGVTIYHGCAIGARAVLHSGTVIGADGFGMAFDGERWLKIPQIGRVVIGDDVEIGANTTIDRGALDDTVIEDGVKLDNQIQIGHNCTIGAHTVIAGCVGIAGSTRIGRYCRIGGAAMIVGHITIADRVEISGGTLISRSIDKPGTYTSVYPFEAHERWIRNAAHLRRLDHLARKVREMERTLAKPGGDKR
jgi:UDP-3-O-[3-hydroxymyristoyl] glucosamine N-acyltransferase